LRKEGIKMIDKIKWLGHASIRIEADKIIYIDPWKLKDGPPADIILVTHEHYDHFSPDDIGKIRKDDTVIVAPPEVARRFSGGGVRALKPGETTTVYGVKVEAAPAYNIDKAFHPREKGWLGFVVTVADTTVYFSGDTDVIPEMKDIRADIWILPIGGTYTMTAEEASRIVNEVRPKTVVPIHWGDLVGSREDAEKFKGLCEATVVIKEVTS